MAKLFHFVWEQIWKDQNEEVFWRENIPRLFSLSAFAAVDIAVNFVKLFSVENLDIPQTETTIARIGHFKK